jgi:3-hydroxy-3-methylglutaryl CoA synthase
VALCGYGSGSHAVIQANVVPDGFKEVSRKFDLMPRLSSRKKLSIEEYEKIHSGVTAPGEWLAVASKRFVLDSIGEGGTRAEGDRMYSLAD